MDTSLEERLKAVEAAIAELKQQNVRPEPNWIEQITGSFKDDPILQYLKLELKTVISPQAKGVAIESFIS